MRDPTRRVVVAFPSDGTSVQLREAAGAGFMIDRKNVQDSQLPESAIGSDGHVLARHRNGNHTVRERRRTRKAYFSGRFSCGSDVMVFSLPKPDYV